jgi:hypothetical protein
MQIWITYIIGRWGALTGLAASGARHPRYATGDESKINMNGSDGMQYVRRRTGEELLPECTLKTVKHPESVMVRECMSARGIG